MVQHLGAALRQAASNRSRLAALCGVIGFAGCATTPTPSGDATPASSIVASSAMRPSGDSGMIVIRRDSGLLGVACAHAVRLDGKLLGELDAGQQVVAYASPGEHQIDASITGVWCANNNMTGASFKIEAGQDKTFRTGWSGLRIFVEHVGTDVPRPAVRPEQSANPPSTVAAPIQARPSAPPSGQYGTEAERLARQCAAQPRAVLAGKGAGFETYTIKCDNGDALAVRCEFGNCRSLR